MIDDSLKNRGVNYRVDGTSPVQGFGSIAGREFHFHANHSNWLFEVANDLGEFPSDVGGNPVFEIQSRHNNAGFLTKQEAIKIIEECCRLFLNITLDHLNVLGK